MTAISCAFNNAIPYCMQLAYLSATVTVRVCSSKGPCLLQLLGIILPETRLQQLLFPNTKLQGKDVMLVLDFKILGLLKAGNVFH